jgi:hypothetical protein
LGSGLTANRINQSNASELYPAFNGSSRSPRPALCYRPLLSFSTGDNVVNLSLFSDLPPQTSATKWPRSCETPTSNRGICLPLNPIHSRWARFYPRLPAELNSEVRTSPSRIWRDDPPRMVREIALGRAVRAAGSSRDTPRFDSLTGKQKVNRASLRGS